jgi:hypothetical protein
MKLSVATIITVNAGASGSTEIYTVEAARKLSNISLFVSFPNGQKYQLGIALFRGDYQVIPTKGVLAGDGTNLTVNSSEYADSGERLILRCTNKDTANPQSCFVVLMGDLE